MSNKHKFEREGMEFSDDQPFSEQEKNEQEDQDLQEEGIESEDNLQEDFAAELKKEKDNFLRLFAEFENYKKRTTKERIELYSTANRELMTALLPILDDFERGLKEIEKASDKSLLQGMQLIYNKFFNTLSQKGLKEVEVKPGDAFDADIHEAISQIPAQDEASKGKIYDVVEKGYKLGDTIIRFPKVVTSN